MSELAEISASRLTHNLRKRGKVRELVYKIAERFYKLIDVLNGLKDLRWPKTAEGKQLDGLGYLVRIERKGRTDDEYRKLLFFQIFVNGSGATAKDLIYATKYLTAPTDCTYREFFPCTVIIFSNGYNVSKDVQELLTDLSAAGITNNIEGKPLGLPLTVSYGDTPFRFSGIRSDEYKLFLKSGNQLKTLLIDDADLIMYNNNNVIGSDNSTFAGLISPKLLIDNKILSIEEKDLIVNSKNSNGIFGGNCLTGVFQ